MPETPAPKEILPDAALMVGYLRDRELHGTAKSVEALYAEISRLRSELERAREDLQSSFLCVFLDGRNEHGSHVLEMPGSNMDPDDVKDIIATLEDQSLGFAEQIITEAESLGHEVGHCVVTIWDLTRDPEWGVECEYRRISPVLTNLMCGSPEAQREVLASSPPVPEQKD